MTYQLRDVSLTLVEFLVLISMSRLSDRLGFFREREMSFGECPAQGRLWRVSFLSEGL